GAGEVSSQRFVEVAPRLEEGWQWLEETWHVDLSGSIVDAVDDEGWSYGLDFGRVAHPFAPGAGLKSVADFVRRRRWIRTRVPLPEGKGGGEADVDVAVAAPLHAMMDGEEEGEEKGLAERREEDGVEHAKEAVGQNGKKAVEENGKKAVEDLDSSNGAGASEAALREPAETPGLGQVSARDGLEAENAASEQGEALDAGPGSEESTAPLPQNAAVPEGAASSAPSPRETGALGEDGLASAAPADERGDVARAREAACEAEPGASDGSFTLQGTAVDASSAVVKDASSAVVKDASSAIDKEVLGATLAVHVPALAFVDGAPSTAGPTVLESVPAPPCQESAPASQSPSEIAVGETSTSQSEELSVAEAARVDPVKPDGLLAAEPLSVSILPTGVELAPAPPAAEPAAVLDSGHLFGGAKGVSRGR
ncbi:hypothetical protein H632_c113p0, partial [Helicosporidium sp. ATCC 50920]